MFITIIIALATYTAMMVSNKLRNPVAIIGTVIMLVYCIVGSVFPLDKFFQKFPIKIAILIFIPCTIYLIGLAVYKPIEIKHSLKNKNRRNLMPGPPLPPVHPPIPKPPPPHIVKSSQLHNDILQKNSDKGGE